MPNREGLGISRKFADGTVHENASGQFRILDRYLEDLDGKQEIMLQFEWITGDNKGQIEVNKEKNINASIHKFKVSRGLPARTNFGVDTNEVMEKLDEVLDAAEHMQENQLTKHHFDKIIELIEERHLTTEEFTETVTRLLSNRVNKDYFEEAMQSRHEMAESLEKLHNTVEQQQQTIKSLTDQMERLTQQRENFTNQQEQYIKHQESYLRQQQTLDKLVEIIASLQTAEVNR